MQGKLVLRQGRQERELGRQGSLGVRPWAWCRKDPQRVKPGRAGRILRWEQKPESPAGASGVWPGPCTPAGAG